MSETWIILGATSAIARSFCRKLAAQNHALILAGRDGTELKLMANDYLLRGALSAKAVAFNTRKPAGFAGVIEAAREAEVINVAVFAGSMPAQDAIDEDPSLIGGVIADNFAGPIRFLQMIAPEMEAREAGVVIGVGSVAGDRGRIGNYVYGSAKAGFHTYLSGLRNRLNRAGGHVITVKPGFVDTAMTWGVEGMFLVASPEQVAKDLLRGVRKRHNVIYTPFFWRYIMLIIRNIPEFIFKKLSI